MPYSAKWVPGTPEEIDMFFPYTHETLAEWDDWVRQAGADAETERLAYNLKVKAFNLQAKTKAAHRKEKPPANPDVAYWKNEKNIAFGGRASVACEWRSTQLRRFSPSLRVILDYHRARSGCDPDGRLDLLPWRKCCSDPSWKEESRSPRWAGACGRLPLRCQNIPGEFFFHVTALEGC